MNRRKLILQIKNGNQEALETIITEMYPQVYAFLYRKMKQNDRAKDITQEVFLKFVEISINIMRKISCSTIYFALVSILPAIIIRA